MSYSILFSSRKVQRYNASSAVYALILAKQLDGDKLGQPIGIIPIVSSFSNGA